MISNFLTKLISGDSRKTRLHDEKGHIIGWKRFIWHSPKALISGVLRITLGIRPELPWISYDAIQVLRGFLTKKSRVLEFGSGMSTIWYANHAGEVYSVEHNRNWYKTISQITKKRNIKNIHYKLASSQNEYIKFMNKDKKKFDLIMIDGEYRSRCTLNAIKLIRPGGIIYLDNSDKHSSKTGGDTRIAEDTLTRFARRNQVEVRYFVDFAPTQLFVQEGMMLNLKW